MGTNLPIFSSRALLSALPMGGIGTTHMGERRVRFIAIQALRCQDGLAEVFALERNSRPA